MTSVLRVTRSASLDLKKNSKFFKPTQSLAQIPFVIDVLKSNDKTEQRQITKEKNKNDSRQGQEQKW